MRALSRIRVKGRGDEYDGASGLTTGSVDQFGRLAVRLDARPVRTNTSAAKGNVYWFKPDELVPEEDGVKTIDRAKTTREEVDKAIADAVRSGETLQILHHGVPKMQIVRPKRVIDDDERGRDLLARAYSLLEMGNDPPRVLLGEIATHLGWAQDSVVTEAAHKAPTDDE